MHVSPETSLGMSDA